MTPWPARKGSEDAGVRVRRKLMEGKEGEWLNESFNGREGRRGSLRMALV